MKNDFNFCPKCGGRSVKNFYNRKWLCSDCGYELYCNIAAAVGVIIYDDDGNILFEIRAKNPRKGFLALPGGFVDADESAEQAVVRECKEELGVEISDVRFLCSNPNTYEYREVEYKTCDIFFAAKLSSNFKNIDDFIKSLKTQESEVSGLVAKKVLTTDDVDELPLAFGSAVKTLKKWLEAKNDL
ncbi:MAG: NUDIX domain-containing protein [Treponema sp.]|nr:NUDIX domain-containing protein [Treponema sp.]